MKISKNYGKIDKSLENDIGQYKSRASSKKPLKTF